VPQALKRFGFENVILVDEQTTPDGNFPTVVYPNPEEKEALTLALKKAQEVDADLVLATDPDADRVGIAVKNTDNEFVLLNGNQTGAMLDQLPAKLPGKRKANLTATSTLLKPL
jgi:phosphoglucomutase